MNRTNHRRMLAAGITALALLAAGCGGDDESGGGSAAEQAADKAVEEAEAEGVTLDRDCVVEVAQQLSDEDLTKIIESADGADVELSAEGEATSAQILACVPKDQLVDQMMTSLAGQEGVDEECVREVFEEMSTDDLQAMVASDGDPSSEAFSDLMGKVMPCITIGG